jgi:hypothetical protein
MNDSQVTMASPGFHGVDRSKSSDFPRIVIPTLAGPGTTVFCSNKIKTSRYTPWSFFPLTFLLQFTKLGNIVWLCVAICNFFPAVAVN